MARPTLIIILRHLKRVVIGKLSANKDMTEQLNKLEENRKLLLSQTASLSVEQYNLIPEEFNNNIIWNMGHILLVGESILYKQSPELRPVYPFDSTNYMRGSKPNGLTTMTEINEIRQLLASSISRYKALMGPEEKSNDSEAVKEEAAHGITTDGLRVLLFHDDMHQSRILKLMQKTSI